MEGHSSPGLSRSPLPNLPAISRAATAAGGAPTKQSKTISLGTHFGICAKEVID